MINSIPQHKTQIQKPHQITIKQPENITFRGNKAVEFLPDCTVTHYTYLFRNMKALSFLKKFIAKNLLHQKEIKIFDGACSVGDETHTLAMLLQKFGAKIKIIGFDIGPWAVSEAKKGEVTISRNGFDNYLAFKTTGQYGKRQRRRLFNNYFFETAHTKGDEEFKTFRVRSSKAGMCSFVQGDIMNPAFIQQGEADAILFRNAMYHFTQNQFSEYPPQHGVAAIKKLIDSVHSKLKDGGLFIVSPSDYDMCGAMYKNLIPKLMKSSGFIPKLKEYHRGFTRRVTVWQKKDPNELTLFQSFKSWMTGKPISKTEAK